MANQGLSPTTSIRRVYKTIAVSFAVALLLCGRGLAHSAAGMPDGWERSVAMTLGNSVLWVEERTGLTWPWDHLSAALGRAPVQNDSPLLASGIKSTPEPKQTRAIATRNDATPGPSPTATPPALFPTRRPSVKNPLRVLITGDSLTEFMGPDVQNDLQSWKTVTVYSETHYGTGLARPDFVDWSVLARQQVAHYHPDAVVVMMGGNDFQNMTLPNGAFFTAPTAPWRREYQRRAEVVMRTFAQGGHARVYWLSIPPARESDWAFADAQINLALQGAAAAVPGAKWVNVLGPITNHGQYSDYVNVNGQPTLMRASDGVHLSEDGSAIVAHEVIDTVLPDWHLKP